MYTNPIDTAFPVMEKFNFEGLSKREYFAAIALQGLLTRESVPDAVKYAVKAADLLIAKLNENEHGINETAEQAAADMD